jgi:hypothetical protein
MWPSIKRLRDWATVDRTAVHVSAELAGLVLSNQPVPWNAEAVIVEAGLRLPTGARRKDDFALHLPNRQPLRPDALHMEGPGDRHHIVFRFPMPGSPTVAEMTWRDRTLGRAEIGILSKETFLESLRLQLPTLHVRIGEESVAAQTFVASQCSGLSMAGLLTAPTSLAPIVECGLTAEVHGEFGDVLASVPVPLSGMQMASRQALVAAVPRKLPRKSGTWTVRWLVGGRELATTRARAISPAIARRSLQLVGTRFVIQDESGITLRRQAPAPAENVKVGPCFLIASSEPGLAASLPFEVSPIGPGDRWTHHVLVTDGPTAVTPGLIPAAALADITGFELRLRGRLLGTLPLHPMPNAKLTAEGGFIPPPDFSWSPAADEELSERLTKLMGG